MGEGVKNSENNQNSKKNCDPGVHQNSILLAYVQNKKKT